MLNNRNLIVVLLLTVLSVLSLVVLHMHINKLISPFVVLLFGGLLLIVGILWFHLLVGQLGKQQILYSNLLRQSYIPKSTTVKGSGQSSYHGAVRNRVADQKSFVVKEKCVLLNPTSTRGTVNG